MPTEAWEGVWGSPGAGVTGNSNSINVGAGSQRGSSERAMLLPLISIPDLSQFLVLKLPQMWPLAYLEKV